MENQSEIETLFERILAGDYDDDEPWEAVRELQTIATGEVFERAAEWCVSNEPLKRARGVDVLAQIGRTADNPVTLFADESFPLLAAILQNDADPRPLGSAIAALGHLKNPAAIPLIIGFRSHPSADLRFDVACALGHFPGDEQSIDALIALMRDEDSDVRDWATFGLGVLGNADNERIRSALYRNVRDSDSATRHEAMAGLAKRGDQRVVRPLMKDLKRWPETIPLKEAACDILGLGWEQCDRPGEELVEELQRRFEVLKEHDA